MTAIASNVEVRPLAESDLDAAERIRRIAFGTFTGAADPESFRADINFSTRWFADPSAAFGAFIGAELIGCNFVTSWGSVGFFGPLSVLPKYWDSGVGQILLRPTVDLLDRRETRFAGLYTFSDSAKHLGLYQKFGFWPRFLTAIMSRPAAALPDGWGGPFTCSLYSQTPAQEREACLEQCRVLTDAIFAGLDLSREIRAVQAQNLGDTLLLRDGTELAGLAVCHRGPGTEAGHDTCYVKFGAVRPGAGAAERFDALLDTCTDLALNLGMDRVAAGVNTGRDQAYRQMLARGFRTDLQGVAMHRPSQAGYSRPDDYVIDDWR